MAIPAMVLLQQHEARRDTVIEPAARCRAAIEARGHSELRAFRTAGIRNWGRLEVGRNRTIKNPPACLSVCLSIAAYPHYCTDPDVTCNSDRGCPLVVHFRADLPSVYGLRCYGNITRTLVTSLPAPRDMTT